MGYARHYKPKMRNLPSFSDIPISLETVITAKLDGEFNVLKHGPDQTYTHNLWDTLRSDLPSIAEARTTLLNQGIESAIMLAELYGVDKEGKMLRLPDFIHEIRSGDRNRVLLGVFDLIEVNGKAVKEGYLWRLQEVETWFDACKLVHVVPYKVVKAKDEVKELWDTWVEEEGYEGLVAHVNGWYKVKKKATIDAVIIGLNKKSLYEKEQVTSFKIALIDNRGRFIEVGDVASGIDIPLRRELWKLTKYGVKDTPETLFIQPFIVVEVEYTETFEADKPMYLYQKGRFKRFEEGVNLRVPFQSLRHPRLLRFRTDKTASKADASVDQLGGIQE